MYSVNFTGRISQFQSCSFSTAAMPMSNVRDNDGLPIATGPSHEPSAEASSLTPTDVDGGHHRNVDVQFGAEGAGRSDGEADSTLRNGSGAADAPAPVIPPSLPISRRPVSIDWSDIRHDYEEYVPPKRYEKPPEKRLSRSTSLYITVGLAFGLAIDLNLGLVLSIHVLGLDWS